MGEFLKKAHVFPFTEGPSWDWDVSQCSKMPDHSLVTRCGEIFLLFSLFGATDIDMSTEQPILDTILM